MRRHLTYANVVATLALVVAVGGGSTAIAISAKKAPKNSVTSASIKNGSVTANDLAKTTIVGESGRLTPSTAVCPGSDRLISGGGVASNISATGQETTSATDRLQRSYPVSSILDGKDGWVAQGLSNGTAFAVCLSAKPGK